MEIKLIKRELKNGRTSLVLEYYLGYTLGANGTTRPKRKFETLEYFLYTTPRNKAEPDHNKINLEMAEKVKAKRLLAEQNEQYGFAVPFKIRTNLVEFIRGMVEQRKDSPGNWGNWDSMLKHLIAYAGTETTFERIDRRFVEGFRTYLAKEARTKSGTALSANSQNSYFLKFKAALNRAVEEGIVPQSPAMGVKATRTEDVHREYLTIEELQRLVKTDCSYPVLKDAFIFSCLTGMRWSDINKLTWGEVQEFDGGTRERSVCIVGNRAVAHRGKEDRHGELQLRRECRIERAVGAAADRVRLFAEKDARFHRLAQRVDRRVRDLRGVDEKPVPVARQRRRVAGGGEKDAARGGLLIDFADRVALPVLVFAQTAVGFYDLDRARRAERNAALTVHAFGFVCEHDLSLGVVGVDAVGALFFADAAARAPLVAPDDLKRRVDVFDSH